MLHYFSPSSGTLGIAAVPQHLPADAIVIDAASHAALSAAQAAGGAIGVGPDGQPAAFMPVPELRRYSPSTGGFYDAASADVPADAVLVSDAAWSALLAAQAAGAVIQPGPDGQPEAVAPAAPDAAAQLAAWRATASLTRLQFALVCTGANLMTAEEAEGLVARGEIPTIGLAALDLIADPAQQALARIRFAGFQRLERLDPAVALLATAAAMLDEDVDALFQAGALL